MGLTSSKKKKVKKKEKVNSRKKQQSTAYVEITDLLLKMNNDLRPKLLPIETFEQIGRTEINLRRLQDNLEQMKDDKTFQQYNTYQMICDKLPIYVISKRKRKDKDGYYGGYYGPPTYFDIYGQSTSNDKVAEILIKFIDNNDIINIITDYIGNDGDLLFSAKYAQSGGATLTDTKLKIDGILNINHCYSEKSGESYSVRILNKNYDKKLYMYLVWIIYELSVKDYRNWNDCDEPVFRYLDFSYDNFMRYEIRGEPRPPPRKSICIVGECEILIQNGYTKKAKYICAGDYIQISNGKLVKVKCSITQIIDDVISICKIGNNNCYITPEHPYRKIGDNKWKIPYLNENVFEMYVYQVMNFILESDHYVVIDNVECITLAHGFQDKTVKHKIWGTNVINEFLKKFPSYPNVIIYGTM